MAGLVAAGQGASSRVVGGRAGDNPPRRPGASDRGAADGVLAVEPRSGARDSADAARVRQSDSSPTVRSARVSHRRFKKFEDLPGRRLPAESSAFQGENFRKNLDLVAKIEEAGAWQGVHGQPARARVGARTGAGHRADPGTKQARFVDENLAAIDVVLTAEDLRAINAVLPAGSAAGDRITRRQWPR